jgi:hypothetical protein
MANSRKDDVQPEGPAISFKELERKRQRLALLHYYLTQRLANDSSVALKGQLFKEQLEVSKCSSNVICLLCARRAGKSFYAAFWLSEGSLQKPGSLNLFVTITRDNARLIVWPELKKLNDALKLGMQFNETSLEASFPNGSRILLRGCKDRPSIERFRGPKYNRVFIDECGAFPPYLKELYQQAIRPGTVDLDGDIIFSGTPGIPWQGFWFELTGPADDPRTIRPHPVFEWTMLQNPHIPHAARVIEEIRKENGWKEDDATYLREYFGRWVEDEGDLVFPWNPQRNGVDALPVRDPLTHQRYQWRYVLGVDYGYVDSTGFVLDAYCSELPEIYTVRSWKFDELIAEQVAQQIRYVQQEVGEVSVVMDYGAAKGIAAEITRRFGITIIPAEKRDRAANIRLLRSEFMAEGRRKIVLGGANDALTDELAVLRWNDDHDDIADGQEDHCADAKMYADRFCRHYAHQPIVPGPEPNTPEWYEAESQRMLQGRLERGRAKQRESKKAFWRR